MSLPETYKVLQAQGPGKEPILAEVPLPKPGKNQILLKVEFAPINPSDTMSIEGTYPVPVPPPFPVGYEGSGTVVALGEDLKKQHQIGDKVHLGGMGTFGQYILTDSERCRKVQEGLSMEEAACHFVNPVTVVAMGHLVQSEGAKAVVHTAGSSALGRMMIRYFKHKGIKTINIVRRDDHNEELKKEGADYILNSTKPDFEANLKDIAHKEGATIVFEAVAGELTGRVMKNLPGNSTSYVYGGLAGGEISGLNVQQFIFEGKTITGFWLTPYLGKVAKQGNLEDLINESYSLLPTILNSNIHKVFKLEEFKEALPYYKENSSKGKILFKPN